MDEGLDRLYNVRMTEQVFAIAEWDEGRDPRTDTAVTTVRRRLHRENELPRGEDYGAFLRTLMEAPRP